VEGETGVRSPAEASGNRRLDKSRTPKARDRTSITGGVIIRWVFRGGDEDDTLSRWHLEGRN